MKWSKLEIISFFPKNGPLYHFFVPFLKEYKQLQMKHIVKRICVFLLVVAPIIGIFAQTETISAIGNSLESGNTNQILPYCAETVTVSILDEDEKQLSKSEAMKYLDNFFSEYPPKSFAAKHDGKSKDGDTFTIGEYMSEDGTVWRTYVVIRANFVHEICIEEDF